MKPTEKYKTANSFRMAVQSKLNQIAKSRGVDVQRLYRQTAYSQFLARLFSNEDVSWALKGGHALELRLQNSRATKDIDLALKESKLFGNNDEERSLALRELLFDKSQIDLGDYFEFIISEAVMELENAPYGGVRFHVDAKIDGKTFSKFLIDIGIGDIWATPQDQLPLKGHLESLGLPPVSVKTISVEQHMAEKIHALTLPRETFNSRVKDLVDMYLLIKSEKFSATKAIKYIEETFTHRNTHEIPVELPEPHKTLEGPFNKMMRDLGEDISMEEVFNVVNQYYKTKLF